MRDLGCHVDRPWHCLQRIKIFGETLPLPFDTFRQSSAWYILYAFHQLDEKVSVFGFDGGKSYATISHYNGSYPVPA